MKRTLPFYLLACLCTARSLPCFSQQDSLRDNLIKESFGCNTFSVSTAMLTTPYLLNGYRPGRPTMFEYANKGSAVAFCIAYTCRITNRCYLGVNAMLDQQHGDWLNNFIPGGNVFNLQTTRKGAFIRTDYTAAVDFIWDYTTGNLVRCYMRAGIGGTYEEEQRQYDPEFYNKGFHNGVNEFGDMRSYKNGTRLCLHYSPIGLRIGRAFSYFIEAGFGYRGVFNTGLSYCFKPHTPVK